MLQHGDRVPATFRCSRDALADCASGLAAAIGRTAAVRAAQPRRQLRPSSSHSASTLNGNFARIPPAGWAQRGHEYLFGVGSRQAGMPK